MFSIIIIININLEIGGKQMKTVYKNGLPVKYSFNSTDGGVDKCFETMANDNSLILLIKSSLFLNSYR